MKSLARSRRENGSMEATRGLCSTAPVQPSAKGAAIESVELVHARTRPRGQEEGSRPCAADVAAWTAARHVLLFSAHDIAAADEERGQWWGGGAGRKAARHLPNETSPSAGAGCTDGCGQGQGPAARSVPPHKAAAARKERRDARREAVRRLNLVGFKFVDKNLILTFRKRERGTPTWRMWSTPPANQQADRQRHRATRTSGK